MKQFLHTSYFSPILHLDIIKSEINFKLKVKMNKILYISFSMGIDHSNPYIYFLYTVLPYCVIEALRLCV